IVVVLRTSLFFLLRRTPWTKHTPYTTLLRSVAVRKKDQKRIIQTLYRWIDELQLREPSAHYFAAQYGTPALQTEVGRLESQIMRSEEHTSELQSREKLVCRLLLEKKK